MRKAGSLVLDRLRERILVGLYFGTWAPGDRLPSVRQVAAMEDVDRKTAAAAYRRLAKEGLVAVEARSGVYLQGSRQAEVPDPLATLHRQWLESTLNSAFELGLDTESVARMLQGVAVVQERPIPVVDGDPGHAALLAAELKSMLDVDARPCAPDSAGNPAGLFRDAPFLVATPVAAGLIPRARRRVVRLTLCPELFEDVRRHAARGMVTVIVGTRGLELELRRALRRGLAGPSGRVRVIRPGEPSKLDVEGEGTVLVWPGSPAWVRERLDGGARYARRLISERTLSEVRGHVARAALETINKSNAIASR